LASDDGGRNGLSEEEVQMLRGPEDEEQDEVMTQSSVDSNEGSTDEEEE
jgi:hypothetical protein